MQPELVQLALEYFNIAMVRVDAGLGVVEWTGGATRFAVQPLKAKANILDIFPALASLQNKLAALLLAASDQLELHKIEHYQVDGSLVYFSLAVLRTYDNETGQPQLLCLLRDVTAEAELEHGLAKQYIEIKLLQQKLQEQSQLISEFNLARSVPPPSDISTQEPNEATTGLNTSEGKS